MLIDYEVCDTGHLVDLDTENDIDDASNGCLMCDEVLGWDCSAGSYCVNDCGDGLILF